MYNILIIDDEQEMIDALRNILEQDGYTVTATTDGVSALKKVENNNFDVVLLDVRIPGMDGIQILEQIKKTNKNLPVIMVTGYGDTKTSVQAMKLGAFDYISKPFNYEELINLIEKAVQMNKLEGKSGIYENQLTRKPEGARAIEKEKEKKIAQESVPYIKHNRIQLKVVFAICLSVIILSLGIFYYLQIFSGKTQIYLTTCTNPSAITCDKEYLWINDWVTNIIYKHKLVKQLPVVKKYSFNNLHLTGIALAGNMIFTCDIENKKIYKHNIDDNLTIIDTYPSPGISPSGIFWDGKYLWSCDAESDKIYKQYFDGKNLVVIETYPSPSTHPIGVAYYKEYLWSADADTNKIYKHELDKTLSVVDTYYIPKEEASISSFTLIDGKIWVVTEDNNKVFSYSLSHIMKNK
ncbi:MAG: response regulator [Candidatus Firestonebacteria bacterium]